ncbi:MAG: hypothetical protein NZ960_03350 [Candidatus Kapabacteria bacterium]|nr:hypothetical protein [Candidatus Kapabacteria bacterium]MDW8012305.1 hypothetical protein [Bacteroidota bacterium]
MVERVILFGLGFFLVSRLLTEKLRLLPKWVDVLDMPLALSIVVLGFLFRPALGGIASEDERRVARFVFLFLLAVGISVLANADRVLLPAVLLFTIGFAGGPLLFLALRRWVVEEFAFARELQHLLFGILVLNLLVVAFLDFPAFLSHADPDRLSGTFGNNPYQFSFFLAIAAGMLLGASQAQGVSRIVTIALQVLIFAVYYLLQFRAGFPFFLVAYGTTLVALYGRQVLRGVIVSVIALLLSAALIERALEELAGQAQQRLVDYTSRAAQGDLGYGDLLLVLANPGDYLHYAKFQAFPATFQMFWDHPWTFLVGVGPGNYVSRAYYTFAVEFSSVEQKGKGVGGIIQQLFGMTKPWTTEFSQQYLGSLPREIVFGSYIFASPYSSYLAPLAEVGILGAVAVFGLYGYLLRRSYQLVRLAREHASEVLPVAVATLMGAIYLFGLGFVDNWWEVTRVVFPLWLFFWTVQAVVSRVLSEPIFDEDQEIEKT